MSGEMVVTMFCTIFVLFCMWIIWDELATLIINQVGQAKCDILNEMEKVNKPFTSPPQHDSNKDRT